MVGKTALLTRLVRKYFSENYTATVGTGFQVWETNVMDKKIRLNIWDTAGQEQYRSLGPIFYQNAEAAIVCYSLNKSESAQSIPFWIEQFISASTNSPIIAIAATKSDLRTNNSSSVGDWAKKKGYIYFETSAKTGDKVIDLFVKVAEEITDNFPTIPTLNIKPIVVPAQQHEEESCC